MAQSRRRRENDTFTDMAEVLPIQENAKDLDKASILRVAINYLKLRELVGEKEAEEQAAEAAADAATGETAGGVSVKVEESDEESVAEDLKSLDETKKTTELPNYAKDVLQALDGFMLVISSDGRILYTSESISTYLGLRQVDVIGISMAEIVHPQDIAELAAVFKTQGNDSQHVFDRRDPLKRNFVVRMRCAFTPSVRSIARCSNFKPIYCSASLKFGKTEQTRGKFQGVVALCKLASVSRIREMCVGAFFKTKHGLDLGYTGIDTRIRWILGYDPTEMMGHKAYQYFHPQDLTATSSCHMNLLTQGHSHSPCYRFMSRWGDWLWVRSKSYVTYNPISHMPDGLLIYTWIVRIDEEDDRMKAIQDGKAAVEKEYTTLGTSISTEGGSLDIAKLADPNAISGTAEPANPPTATSPRKVPRPAMIEKRESGYLSISHSSPYSSATMPSPPQSVATPPDPTLYNPQQLVSGTLCGSPDSQPSSCQSSLNTGQTGFFGSTHSLQQPTMPSPPYDSSPPQPTQQFINPYITGANFQGYDGGYGPDPMAPIASGYATQYEPQPMGYTGAEYMPQPRSLPVGQGGIQFQPHLQSSSVNNSTFTMQATVFTSSPESSTICYQPPNLTDLQLPTETQAYAGGYAPMPPATSVGTTGVRRGYVASVREKYAKLANPVQGGIQVGSKRSRETTNSQNRGISEWSSQWLQGSVPQAHVY